MTTQRPSVPGPVGRLRARLKATVYSGAGRDRWQAPSRVLDALALREGMRVADVGAGGGYFTLPLARMVGPSGHVDAVDADREMLWLVATRAEQQGLANVTPVAALGSDPQLSAPVDLVLVVDALHHLPRPTEYLGNLVRCLTPGGRVAVIEPIPRWWLFGHATPPAAVRRLLDAAGLTVEAEHGFLPGQSFVVARAG